MTKHIDPATLAGAVPAGDDPLAAEAAAPVPATDAPADTAAPFPDLTEIPFDPARLQPRRDGWTAFRQRLFINTLAETGCVRTAAEEAGVTPRSAYRLKLRPEAAGFAAAWAQAQTLGYDRLVEIAHERAITGAPRVVRHEGKMVGFEHVPSDRLLIFLLTHLKSTVFGNLSGLQPARVVDPAIRAREKLAPCLAALTDMAPPADTDDEHETFHDLWNEP